ncbi:MAG: aminodeoxychorismate/anthranilate synthase component II [Pseudomonadota bacterium]
MILIIDNRDSFVFNIARYFEELGETVRVVDSHAMTVEDIRPIQPKALVISPGPCTPKQAGISLEAISAFSNDIPILGVCLGHQAIAEVYGVNIERAITPRHGRSIDIRHCEEDLFAGLQNPFGVGLYHSLAVGSLKNTPLIAQAWSDEGEIMALRHSSLPLFGVQFHPESVLSDHGHEIFQNFLQLSQKQPA